ncbi:helix-turn-helix transcriptional regulator [Xanthocytophaga agilis]|uniref:Helix-turn-helix transcriptional regulator n=1 Tax=Xanthocytophaga agilis TaxID=3048010 RepID=A0AAE3R7W6_9BACT|nr:helix-turn-helix transcriptional regulator [Xanthocytophaga agilis]MDJ1503050.1 helix-turn-helix transcriptional regulator [Xanthocytophaga agilis]
MIQQQTLQDYPFQYLSSSANQSKDIFAAYSIEDFSRETAQVSSIYCRRDFYKITLISGDATYSYGDRQVMLQAGQYALLFTNREIPYKWEIHSGTCQGYGCVFTDDFLPLHTYLRPSDWTVFDPNGQSLFYLNTEQVELFSNLFKKMIKEYSSSYLHKQQLIFIYLLEFIHEALRMEPSIPDTNFSAANRLTESFRELLAQQFLVITSHQKLKYRTAQDFADKLAVHVNYLNRTLKAVTGKTTTQLINERIIQEARILLLHTNLPINQIGYCLGFEEATHFTHFFHKHTQMTPSSLRQV